eukprot:3353954-Pleurochrysis_carterae.AAC.1
MELLAERAGIIPRRSWACGVWETPVRCTATVVALTYESLRVSAVRASWVRIRDRRIDETIYKTNCSG